MRRDRLIREADKAEDRPAEPAEALPAQSALLRLQRSAGNAAVSRLMLQRQPAGPTTAPAVDPWAAPDAVSGAAQAPTFGELADAAEAAIGEMKAAEATVAALKADKKAKKADRKAAATAYATATKAHQSATLALAGWTREHVPNKTVIDGFLDRTDVPNAEKVATLGKLAAATARMEFLLGTMYHQGVKAKWEKDNTGVFPDVYEKAVGGGSQPWCTKFAGYAFSRLGFKAAEGEKDTSMFHSGYRLRHWGQTGKNVDNTKQLTPEDETLVGMETSGALIDSKEFKQLKKDLKKAKTAEDRVKVTEAFFAEKPVPQAGDIVVKPRGEGQGDNWFTGGGSSHTMMVDQFDAATWTISTVEGNVGDKVGARKINLTDPAHVGDIIFIARMGMEYFGDPATKEEPPPGGVLGGIIGAVERVVRGVVYSEEVLLGSMEDVNTRLVAIDAAQGWIKSSNVDASVMEWIKGEETPSEGPVKEE